MDLTSQSPRTNRVAKGAVKSPEATGLALAQRELSRGDGPLYRQLAGLIRESIGNGALTEGSELPREADLAASYSVSLITVRHALRELEIDGLIKKRAAKQAIVTSPGGRLRNTFSFKSFAEIAASAVDKPNNRPKR